MTCVTFASSKGGAGKTTTCVALAFQFARAGYDTVVLELDRNRPIADLARIHESLGHREANLTFAEDPPESERLPITLKRLQRDHEILLVDLPGAASTEMLTATGSADLVIVPMQAGRWDAREAKATYDEIIALTEDMKTPPIVRILLTRTPSSPIVPRYYKRATAAVRDANLPRLSAELIERKAWRDIQEGGMYPEESSPASENAQALYEEILALLVTDDDNVAESVR